MSDIYSSFEDEATALEEIKAAGYFPLVLDFPPEKNAVHWHDFNSLTYILDGHLTVEYTESGEVKECPPGTKIVGQSGVLHREKTEGYKALFGFSVDPKNFTHPVNKPPK